MISSKLQYISVISPDAHHRELELSGRVEQGPASAHSAAKLSPQLADSSRVVRSDPQHQPEGGVVVMVVMVTPAASSHMPTPSYCNSF